MPRKPRDYLIIPPEPTPNGGLHLGHIAGPFLPCDVLARFVRVRGDHAWVVTAVDSFEPWALQHAASQGVSLAAVIEPNIEKMTADLEAMSIEVDAFIRPHDPDVFAELCLEADTLIAELSSRDMLVEHFVPKPYFRATGESLVGPDLVAKCPACGAVVSGSSCESCGGMWTPATLVDPRASNGEAIDWREVKQISVQMPAIDVLMDQADAVQLQPRLRETLEVLHSHVEGRLRADSHEDAGITAQFPDRAGRTPLYSYFGGLVFARYAGRRHNSRLGLPGSAFDAGATTVLVNSLGIDNVVSTIGYIDSIQVALEKRPYDRVFVNEFLLLEGTKFSTSRNHLIRPANLEFGGATDRDSLRVFLATHDLTQSELSFSPDAFESWRESTFAPLFEALLQREVDSAAEMDAIDVARFTEHWMLIQEHLDARRIRLPSAVETLLAWLSLAKGQKGAAGIPRHFLAATAVLAAPLAPVFARKAWGASGLDGAPSFPVLAELLGAQLTL